MNIIRTSEAPLKANAHNIEARALYTEDLAHVVHMLVKPGQSLKRHITPVDVLFYVLSGEGYVEIGEEKELVSEGALIESPKNITQCWYNESDRDLRVLVMKIPGPTEKTRIL